MRAPSQRTHSSAWLLGDAPAGGVSGPPWDSGGNYPPAEDLVYVDALATACPVTEMMSVNCNGLR